jgi:TolB protein
MRNVSNRLIVPGALALALLLPGWLRAQVTVDVVGGGGDRIPVAVVQFHGSDSQPVEHRVANVIAQDLMQSSAFKVLQSDGHAAHVDDKGRADTDYFKGEGADLVVAGSFAQDQAGNVRIDFALIDLAKGHPVFEDTISGPARAVRHHAHTISDRIHMALTGTRGAYATRICYIARSGDGSELVLSDADGYNLRVLHRSNAPIMSPRWSPDGKRIAYVSFERQRPRVYVHDITTGTRHVVAKFRGTNSAPAWSPDSGRLAVALSKDGDSQIYLVGADGANLRRLMTTRSRDTEPSFSPDGRHILFTSDRSGQPQIYRIAADGTGRAERMTFEGSYNASPRYSPDGKSFAFVQLRGGRYNVAIQNFATGEIQYLTSGHEDRYPAFAPNGKAILYATEVGGRGRLGAAATDGRTRWDIGVRARDVRGPDWGPFTAHRWEIARWENTSSSD